MDNVAIINELRSLIKEIFKRAPKLFDGSEGADRYDFLIATQEVMECYYSQAEKYRKAWLRRKLITMERFNSYSWVVRPNNEMLSK